MLAQTDLGLSSVTSHSSSYRGTHRLSRSPTQNSSKISPSRGGYQIRNPRDSTGQISEVRSLRDSTDNNYSVRSLRDATPTNDSHAEDSENISCSKKDVVILNESIRITSRINK